MTEPDSTPVVLVVEDEMVLRMRAVDIVQDAGFVPIEAISADQALEILESRDDISLLFTDIQMPGSMDGLQLAHTTHSRWPHIKIILVSGQVDMVSGLQVEDVDELRALGLQVTVQQNPQVKSLALRNLKPGPSPLKDVRVRRALNYAVDKDAIANLMMLGYVTPVGQGAPEGITGHNPDVKPYPYDPARRGRCWQKLATPTGWRCHSPLSRPQAHPMH